MDQDFAKRRSRTPLAESNPPPKSSGLVILMIGVFTGVVVGLFIALLVYMSGQLPPPPGQSWASDEGRSIETPGISGTASDSDELTDELQREAARLQLEFYRELPDYEVVVDVTPVEGAKPRGPQTTPAEESQSNTAAATESSDSATRHEDTGTATVTATATATSPPPSLSSGSYMLQAGAFRQQNTASAQLNRLLNLGLSAQIRQENMPGRTLFLVQAGPYASREDMLRAEQILRSNSIDTMRITLSPPGNESP